MKCNMCNNEKEICYVCYLKSSACMCEFAYGKDSDIRACDCVKRRRRRKRKFDKV